MGEVGHSYQTDTHMHGNTHTLAVSLSLCLAHTLSHAGLQQGRDGASERDRVQK